MKEYLDGIKDIFAGKNLGEALETIFILPVAIPLALMVGATEKLVDYGERISIKSRNCKLRIKLITKQIGSWVGNSFDEEIDLFRNIGFYIWIFCILLLFILFLYSVFTNTL